jgi:hypothetical protein
MSYILYNIMKFLHINSTKNISSKNEDTICNPMNIIDLGHEHLVDYYTTYILPFSMLKCTFRYFEVMLPNSNCPKAESSHNNQTKLNARNTGKYAGVWLGSSKSSSYTVQM